MQHFGDHQAYRKRSSRLLVTMFVASVVLLLSALFAVTYFAIQWRLVELPKEIALSAATTVVISAGIIIGIAVLIKMSMLARGGIIVAQEIGGEYLGGSELTLRERQLLNVVDEMAVAASIPSPGVYILRHEQGINAFTAGSKIGNAVIGITQGALDHLSRDELQAIVAHEFGHIVNGDVGLNYRMISLLFGIECMYMAGLRLMGFGHHTRWGWRGSRNSPSIGIAIAGFVLFLLGACGRICADFIKQAVNRQREYLADAMSTEFTRNPSALVGAFEAIQTHRTGGRVLHQNAGQIAQLFIVPPIGQLFSKASHPSLEKRIDRLKQMGAKYPDAPKRKVEASNPSNASGRPLIPEHSLLFVAQQALRNIPGPCWEAAHDKKNVLSLILALLVNSAPEEEQSIQESLASRHLNSDQLSVYHEYRRLLVSMPTSSALAIASICAPALKALDSSERKSTLDTLVAFIKADSEISLLEWSVLMIIEFELSDRSDSQRRIKRLRDVSDAVSKLSHAMLSRAELTTEHQRFALKTIEENTGIQLGDALLSPNFEELAHAVRSLRNLDDLPQQVLLKSWAPYAQHEATLLYETLEISFTR